MNTSSTTQDDRDVLIAGHFDYIENQEREWQAQDAAAVAAFFSSRRFSAVPE
jgi:hypothetical protein